MCAGSTTPTTVAKVPLRILMVDRPALCSCLPDPLVLLEEDPVAHAEDLVPEPDLGTQLPARLAAVPDHLVEGA